MKAKGYTLKSSQIKLTYMSELQKKEVETRTENVKSLIQKIINAPWITKLIIIYKNREQILKLLNEILAILRIKD